ncbi:MAG: PKD domain protein [Prevotella sp.]|nr:PKD domain protein [Prevotella sp.]
MKKQTTMIRNIFKTALLLFAACSIASCISDESEYGNESNIPTLKVTGDDQTDMPVYNFNLGETVVINPTINYSGNTAELTYHWQVGSYANSVKGELKEAGSEPSLTYTFDQGGTYYAHLTVTDGRVGRAVDYQINVNRTFEQGYVLVSNDAQGNGNLAFVSIPTNAGDKPVLMEHCLERMNDGMTVKNLLGMEVFTITWPSTITRVFVLGQDKGYCIDGNTFAVLTDVDYSEIYPGFKATNESCDGSAPFVYDAAQKKTIHMNVQYMFPYEATAYVGQAYDQFQATKYLRWSRLYDNQLYVDYQKPQVAIYYAYATYFGYSSPFVSSGEMLNGQKLLAAFNAAEYGDACCPLYLLTQSADGKTARLYENTQDMYPEEQYFTVQELQLTGDEALPAQGTRFYASPTYKRYFYPVGGRLYAFLTEGTFAYPKTSQYVYDFGQGETITAMSIDISEEKLFVATQTTSTGRGNFYIFNCADLRTDNQGNVKPIEAYKDCADRIVSIVNKPRIQ